MAKDKDIRSRSWFCVLNNIEINLPVYVGKEPAHIVDDLCKKWQEAFGDNCSCAIAYCISAGGLHHLHLVLENPNKVSFTQVRNFLGGKAHLEITRGTKKQAEDYIYKRGAFEEKGEKIEYIKVVGEIKGSQGRRNELDAIEDLIKEGRTPTQIYEELGFMSLRYESLIKSAYFKERIKDTPRLRSVDVIWHCGATGSGKTHAYEVDPRPDDDIYIVKGDDLMKSGCWDGYFGQRVVYINEFKGGQIKYAPLLDLLEGYRMQLACRYVNGYQLWEEVNITSIFCADEIYKKMVADEDKEIDSLAQLTGRITKTVYHFCLDKDNNYVKNPREYKAQNGRDSVTYHEIIFDGFADRSTIERKRDDEIRRIKSELAKEITLFSYIKKEAAL